MQNIDIAKKEFENAKFIFDNLENYIINECNKKEFYKGPFYNIKPFSCERLGYKKGKLIKNPEKIKNTNDIYIYYFNNDKVICIKKGLYIQDKFYTTFIKYINDCIILYNFDYSNTLMSVELNYIKEGVITESILYGVMGIRLEKFIYNNNTLVKVFIENYDFDLSNNNSENITLIFNYNYGNLTSISEINSKNVCFNTIKVSV